MSLSLFRCFLVVLSFLFYLRKLSLIAIEKFISREERQVTNYRGEKILTICSVLCSEALGAFEKDYSQEEKQSIIDLKMHA